MRERQRLGVRLVVIQLREKFPREIENRRDRKSEVGIERKKDRKKERNKERKRKRDK